MLTATCLSVYPHWGRCYYSNFIGVVTQLISGNPGFQTQMHLNSKAQSVNYHSCSSIDSWDAAPPGVFFHLCAAVPMTPFSCAHPYMLIFYRRPSYFLHILITSTLWLQQALVGYRLQSLYIRTRSYSGNCV